MKYVVKFMMKDWLKTKWIPIILILMIAFVSSLYLYNQSQAETTVNQLKESTEDKLENVMLLLTTITAKNEDIGASENEIKSLKPLAKKEEALLMIRQKLEEGNLDIANNQITFYDEYTKFIELKPIFYMGRSDEYHEKNKAIFLLENELPYLEEKTPYNSALFTKQVFEILFNPITLFLFLVIFSYLYTSDRENRIVDFLKLQSLSSRSIYSSYLLLLFGSVMLYVIIGVLLASAPVLLSGNWESIHYPVEVLRGTELVFIPVWKLLLFKPLSWLIFMTLVLLLFTSFMKQKASVGSFAVILVMALSLSYLVYSFFGFQLANPLHLLGFTAGDFFITNTYLVYLGVMGLVTTLLTLGVLYFIGSSKSISVKLPVSSSNLKERSFYPKWQLFQFEYRKKKRKRHIAITIALVLITQLGVFFYIQNQVQALPRIALNLIDEKQKFITKQITNTELNHENLAVEIEIMRQNDEKLNREPGEYEEDFFLDFLDVLNEQYDEFEELRRLIYEENFPQLFNDLESKHSGGSYKDLEQGTWTVSSMASEEQRTILKSSGIDSWPYGVYWVSHFDDPELEEDAELAASSQYLQNQNQKYDSSSQFMLYKFFEWNMMGLILFAFVAFLWTAVSEERTPQSTISFLSTKPLSFQSVYTTKWLYNLLSAAALQLLVGGIVFCIATLIGGFGESAYPIPVYSIERLAETDFYAFHDQAYFSFTGLGTLILTAIALAFAQLFFLNGLFTFIGKLLKNYYVTVVLTLVVVIIGYWTGTQTVKWWNPFIYFDTWRVVDGWKTIEAASQYATPLTGIGILVVAGSVLFITGFFVKIRAVS